MNQESLTMHTPACSRKSRSLCAGALLLACADVARHPGATQGFDADRAYDQGRQHHLAGRYDEAIAAYRTVLAAAPRHVRARNALAAAFARQGDFAQAIPIWRALTDETGARHRTGWRLPVRQPRLRLPAGRRLPEGGCRAGKACVLDPLDHRAWRTSAKACAGSARTSAPPRCSARPDLAQPRFPGRLCRRRRQRRWRRSKRRSRCPARPDSGWAATEVRTAADGTLELLRLPSQRALAHTAPVRAARPSRRRAARLELVLLEIRNGNGVSGMARALSRQVMGDGLQVTRLSNEKGFQVRRTRIEHGARLPRRGRTAGRAPGLRAGRFEPVQIVQVDNCKPTDMRLVLGQDLARGQLVLRPPCRVMRTLAAADLPGKAP
jgi:hypothetical protein